MAPKAAHYAAQSVLAAHMPSIHLDEIDLRILNQLQADAKVSNVELSRRVNLSPSPCLARVRALEKAGVIQRYVTLLNPLAVGLGVSVFVHVSLETQGRASLEAFEAAVREKPEVMECYVMTGDEDYLLRVAVTDLVALERFLLDELSRIPGISRIKTSFALKQVKYETALPLAATEKGKRPQSPGG